MYKRLITSALIFGAAALAPPAAAQPIPCYIRTDLVAALTETYDETLAGAGLVNAQELVELWRSTATGTFTILLSRPDGSSCVLLSGANWQAPSPKPSDTAG